MHSTAFRPAAIVTRMSFPRWIPACLTLLLPWPAGLVLAQAPTSNVMGNGGFERATRTDDNLWDGVDGDGNLAVPTFSARVLTEGSALGSLAMPGSVAVADLNADGKRDLLVASPNGYFFYYQNRGTPAEPRFTNAEVLPIFLSASPVVRDIYHAFGHERDHDRFCPRICLADWRKRGTLDLLVGNFLGELLFVPNTGAARQPVFSQPAVLDRARVQTDDRNRLWANLLSPAAADWNNDGKLDVLTGEGTYSANAIRLLENIGGEVPKFTETKRSRIAYGDGREQLIPAVADINGDGNPDLLVADRSGEIGVYLNPGAPGPGVELKRVATISFGGASKLPGLVAPCGADLNGDGLFDLVLGLPNGRIAVAYNTGTRTQPEFGAWREINGEDRLKRNVRVSTDWETDSNAELGNGLAYFQIVNAQEDPASEPPEGANCLKVGYWPPAAGGVFPFPDGGIPQSIPHFLLVHPFRAKIGQTYKVSFKVKASGMEKCHVAFDHYQESFTGALKLERGERGEGVREGKQVREEVRITNEFTPSSSWSTVEKSLNLRYKSPELKDQTEMEGSFIIDCSARSRSSVMYIDDIRIVPQG